MEEKEQGLLPIIIFPLIALLCMVGVLVLIYPLRPHSVLGWLALYIGSLPVIMLFEWLGGVLFGSKYSSKVSRGSRILYGAIVGVVVLVLATAIVNGADPFLSEWGA